MIRRAALTMLTRRDYTEHEITQKLLSKRYPIDEIRIVTTTLVQAGLINEARFVENFIHWRRNKGYGPQRISMELQARGVKPEMIAEHLEIADNAWFAEIQNVWQKHFRGKLPTDFKSKAKQIRFLQYRGFTREQIESVFKVDVFE